MAGAGAMAGHYTNSMLGAGQPSSELEGWEEGQRAIGTTGVYRRRAAARTSDVEVGRWQPAQLKGGTWGSADSGAG